MKSNQRFEGKVRVITIGEKLAEQESPKLVLKRLRPPPRHWPHWLRRAWRALRGTLGFSIAILRAFFRQQPLVRVVALDRPPQEKDLWGSGAKPERSSGRFLA